MIGVLGGTFDPVHHGHLRTALEVMQEIGLDEVRFLPLYRAVHREQPLAAAADRLEMLRAAIADQPGFVVDERELRRRGDSYMVDTLASLRAESGERPICLLLGSDAFSAFLQWREPSRILELAHLIVMRRPGDSPVVDTAHQALLAAHQVHESNALQDSPAGCILLQPVSQLEISSTRIRQIVAAGLDPRYLLPDAVRHLILEKRLYLG